MKRTRIEVEMTIASPSFGLWANGRLKKHRDGWESNLHGRKTRPKQNGEHCGENPWSCKPEELVWDDYSIKGPVPDKKLKFFDQLVRDCRRRGLELREEAWNREWASTGTLRKARAHLGNPILAVHVAEVQVDTETGKVDVLNYVAAHDSGTVLIPTQFKSQIYGGVVQGLGYALMEELVINNGKIMNASFLDYYFTSADIPTIKPILVEAPDIENGPFGAKGIGDSESNQSQPP